MSDSPAPQPSRPRSSKPPTLFEAVGIRGAIAGVLVLGLAIALVTCRDETAAPPDTVGVVGIETTPTTLLEFVPDTDPPDPSIEPTVPPQSLFGGDPCASLVAADFNIVIAGLGRGQLIDASPLSFDMCGFLVRVADQEFYISVQALDPTSFGRPPAEGEERIALTNIGLSAYGVAVEEGYSIWVKVANGYFVVIAPDPDSARHLAVAAARRSDDPAVTTTVATTIAP